MKPTKTSVTLPTKMTHKNVRDFLSDLEEVLDNLQGDISGSNMKDDEWSQVMFLRDTVRDVIGDW